MLTLALGPVSCLWPVEHWPGAGDDTSDQTIIMTSTISVTKLRNSSTSSSHGVTVRPVRSSTDTFTPLATYLSLRSVQQESEGDSKGPSIEIINNYNDDNNELPPGTKIITHPMNSGHFWGSKKTDDISSKRYFELIETTESISVHVISRHSRTSEDLKINDIVRRLQQVNIYF